MSVSPVLSNCYSIFFLTFFFISFGGSLLELVTFKAFLSLTQYLALSEIIFLVFVFVYLFIYFFGNYYPYFNTLTSSVFKYLL